MSQVIIDKIKSLVDDGELFTSVDVSNAIKRDGVWIRNKEVAKFLRTYDFSQHNYNKELINVTSNNIQTKATVYFPDYSDAQHYKLTSQTTIKKHQLPTQKMLKIVSTSNQISNLQTHNAASQFKTYKIKCPKKIRVPAKLVRIFNSNPGTQFDISNIDIVCFKNLPSKMKVNKDGRINIATSYLKTKKQEILISITNNKISFA
jgi:hypothetical protein